MQYYRKNLNDRGWEEDPEATYEAICMDEQGNQKKCVTGDGKEDEGKSGQILATRDGISYNIEYHGDDIKTDITINVYRWCYRDIFEWNIFSSPCSLS